MSAPFADRLRGLLPPVAYDPHAPMLSAVIEAEANALQGVETADGDLADRMHPATADDDVASWERVYGLHPAPTDSLAKREQLVLAKMGELGGLSLPYFVRLAASAGYAVTITEPRAFRAGVGRCGDRLYPEDIVFVWQVHIDRRPVGATAAMDAALERTFTDLEPAHTLCVFVEY